MNLVIVESPAKGRTIEHYLGSDYKVVASFGHVRDLPAYKLGVDVNDNFKPEYVVPSKAKKIVSHIREMVKKAKKVYLATDYDREGEAIAWHIAQAVGLDKSKDLGRITFHEITKEAIQEAIKHPREIDTNLVDAQQARRILDRLVGYQLSPFLWAKIYKGLSAGRVQSVAVRLVVDREREIEKFIPEEYWSIIALLVKKENKLEIKTILKEKNGKKIEKLAIKSNEDAQTIIKELEGCQYQVKELTGKTEKRWPSAPFITSTLQQEASFKLGFSAKKTMKLAQDLYEAGHITYMRTDSTNLSSLAVNASRKFIEKEFGAKYLPVVAPTYKTKVKGAQEAHEAIRPSYIEKTVNKLAGSFSEDHLKLYELIWQRAVASQMMPAEININIALIEGRARESIYIFETRGVNLVFDGFSRVWPTKIEEKELPRVEKDEILDLHKIDKTQHFTEPPAHYSEATLIKALEEKGIGRPSTYAPILSTIEERGYVRKEKKYLFPQEIGFIVTDLLIKHFPNIVDLDFTAKMEEDLDKIADGEEKWQKTIASFYGPFEANLNNKYDEVEKKELIKVEETDEVCPKCGKKMLVRMGKFGKFLACSGFPNCKTTKAIITKIGKACPKCQKGEIIEKRTKKGKVFWGCSVYPACDWASWERPN